MRKIKLSEYCKRIREKTGMNVSAFARAKDISDTQIIRIEKGLYDKDPSPLVISRICKQYSIPITELQKIDIKANREFIERVRSYYTPDEKPTLEKRDQYLDYFVKEYLKRNGFTRIEKISSYTPAISNQVTMNLAGSLKGYDIKCLDEDKKETYCFVINDPITINARNDYERITDRVKSILFKIMTNPNISSNDINVFILTPSDSIFDYLKHHMLFNNFQHLKGLDFFVATCRTNREIKIHKYE